MTKRIDRNARYLELALDGKPRLRALRQASREVGYPWWWNGVNTDPVLRWHLGFCLRMEKWWRARARNAAARRWNAAGR